MKKKVIQNITETRTSLENKLMGFLMNDYKIELWKAEWDKLFIIASSSNNTMVKKWTNLRKIVTDLYNNI